MPVPVPRQRAIPAAESGREPAAPARVGPSGPPSGGPSGGSHTVPTGEGADLSTTRTTPVDRPDARPTAGGPGTTTNLTVLLIEDDPAGSLSVPELLDSAGKPIKVRTARNLTEAERLLTDDVHCILLDLALRVPGPAHAAPSIPAHPQIPAGAGALGTSGTGSANGMNGANGSAPRHANGAGPATASGNTNGPASTPATATAGSGTGTLTGPGGPGGPGNPAAPGGTPGGHGEVPGGGTPGGTGDELAVLRRVLRLAPRHAVLALTASGDAERGAEAVRVGAQDYLFRDELDGRLLSRAIRYAVERKRSDTAERRLTESKLRAQENARLERGLLPTPLLEGSKLRFAARYRPGRSRALLGGDFYDTVRTTDGTVHAMIGDVCGHGPDEAALGVELRIAWRALTFAGLCGDQLLSTLQQVLEHERESDEIFATLCTVDIAPDGRSAGLCLAGHPAPLLLRPGPDDAPRIADLLPYSNNGPALGLLPNARWPRTQIRLGGSWGLMLYTDGLIEGRVREDAGEGIAADGDRLGQDGMLSLVRRLLARGLGGEELLRTVVNEVRDLNGGELTDDVAVLLLDRD